MIFQVAQWKNVLYFGEKSNRRYRRLAEIISACALNIELKIAVHVFDVRSVYHP